MFLKSDPAGNRTPILGSEDLRIIRYTTGPGRQRYTEVGLKILYGILFISR